MTTAVILGAGFSLAANAWISKADRHWCNGYPLVRDLATACFNSSYDTSMGVEAAFHEAGRLRDPEPVRKLVELIECADYYAGNAIARAEASPYHALIERFDDASFLSFNYDGLLELLLHHRHLWTPVDGFGISCHAGVDRSYVAAPPPPETSKSQVLHLHGSVYLYPIEIEFYDPPGRSTSVQWFRLTSKEQVHFDPDQLTQSFTPFIGGAQGDLGYSLPPERIIAPVPNKASELTDRFVRAVYGRATEIIAAAGRCVAIGYRFADCDSISFRPLLSALDGGIASSLLIVAPEASEVAKRVQPLLKQKRVIPFDGTLDEWAAADFPTGETGSH